MNIDENNPCHVTFFEPIRWLKSMNGVYNMKYEIEAIEGKDSSLLFENSTAVHILQITGHFNL